MELIGVLLGALLNQVAVQGVRLILIDALQSGLVQVSLVHLAGLVHLVVQSTVGQHLDGNGVEQIAVLIPVSGVLGQDLLVVLDVGGDGVGTIVPHGHVAHGDHVLNALLIDLSLGDGVQAGGGAQSVEVRSVLGAGVDQSVVIGSLQTDHLGELAVLGQLQSLFGRQGHGVVIVLLSTLDQLVSHGGVVSVVLVEVQDPLKSGQPVLSSAICLVVAVNVNPGNIIAQLEGPGDTAVLSAPLGSDCGLQLTLLVDFQQTGVCVAQNVQVSSVLGVNHHEILELVGTGRAPNDQILDGLAIVAGCGCLAAGLGGVAVAGGTAVAGGGLVVAAAASDQGHNHGQGEEQTK